MALLPLPEALPRSAVARTAYIVLGAVVGSLIFAMMAVTFVDVVGRYFFNSPLQGSYELTEVMLAVSIFAALPLTTLMREHVTVDLFQPMFRGRAAGAANVFAALVSATTLGGFAWRLWVQAMDMARYGDASLFLNIPYAPVAIFMAAMSAVSAVCALALLVRRPTNGRAGRQE